MARAPTLPGCAAQLHPLTVDDVELRELVPRVLSVLVRRGADFATAEDAVQEALIRALAAWGGARLRAGRGGCTRGPHPRARRGGRRAARRRDGVAHHSGVESVPRHD